MANENILAPDVLWSHYDTSLGSSGNDNTRFTVLKLDFGGGDIATYKGAVHISGVPIPQGQHIESAELRIYVDARYTSGGNVKAKVWGVKEGNPDTGNPFGRSKTTANNTIDNGAPGVGDYQGIGVTSILQEIVNQGAYVQGNAIEFLIEDNGMATDAGIEDNTVRSFLSYKLAADPNFKPTPVSVAAPALPDAEDEGIKISYPGVSVFDAPEAQLLFTTRKRQIKVFIEDVYTSTGAEDVTIPHGLGYVPASTVYALQSTPGSNWKRLPAPIYFEDSPAFFIDQNNLYLHASDAGQKFYYRIFRDVISV